MRQDVDGADEALRRLVGDPAQLVGVERLVRDEGPGRGAPVLHVRNPRGLSFEVLLDRAMDVGWADAPGLPVAWRSSRGPVASQRYEPQGTGWTRTFGGGLLSTCGLASTGAPSTVDGVHHPLHGRVGHIPAEHVRWRTGMVGGVPAVEICGEVVETDLGAPPLSLRRRLLARTDRPELCIEDVVTNEGFAPVGHMFRHHLNLGYPLVQPGTVVSATATPVGTRDGDAAAALPWTLDVAADGQGAETVLYCRPAPGPTATVTVTAPDGACVEVEQDTDGWPMLVLWRDPRPGTNVLGVEPSTSRDAGRAQAERDGEVRVLPPGGEVRYRTVVRVRP